METFVDAAFPVTGTSLPLDHAYPLFAALSRRLPVLHERPAWGVHPVRGRLTERDVLALERGSYVPAHAGESVILALMPIGVEHGAVAPVE